jgi:hypothetical protein
MEKTITKSLGTALAGSVVLRMAIGKMGNALAD